MKQDWYPDELTQHWTLSAEEREVLDSKTSATPGLNCSKSRPNFYDAERLLPFRICDMRIGNASRLDQDDYSGWRWIPP